MPLAHDIAHAVALTGTLWLLLLIVFAAAIVRGGRR
jgi:hypothetical protein